jgi:hypothetical protein
LSVRTKSIDPQKAGIVVLSGLYDTNPKQPGQQGPVMHETVSYSPLSKRPKVTIFRRLKGIETRSFQGSGCSECAWVFKPSGPPVGDSLEEMKEIYQRRREKEFAMHVCAEHPRAKKAKG